MNIVFQINGGIGKCIAATAVCWAIRRNYPECNLIVISGYPEVFLNNPSVNKNYKFGETLYFYKEFIEGKDFKLFIQDPYAHTSFFREEKHLVQIWCELYGLNYDGEYPQIFLSKREATKYIEGVNVEKPILLMQTNGGADANKKYGWARDLPQCVVKEVIEAFKSTHTIYHVKREDQITYQDTLTVTTDFRRICAIALLSDKRLVIDSFLQHALAALYLPAVACWIVNSPMVYGYELHTNVLANPYTVEPDIRHALFSKFDWTGNEQEFPFNEEEEIFDGKKIIDTLNTYSNKLEMPTEAQKQ
jgi:hypothetical protein